jgi:exportin-T
VDRYPSTSYPEVRFWCLQTLTDAFKTSGVLQTLSDDDASFLQRTLMSWVAEAVQRADAAGAAVREEQARAGSRAGG